jgi:murein DD-endopeptidase MepM/ murein hydrolase activator NlpD
MSQLLDHLPGQRTAPRRRAHKPVPAKRAKEEQKQRLTLGACWRLFCAFASFSVRRFRAWAFIRGRRAIHSTHNGIAGRHAVGPVSFLGVSGALAVVLTLTTLYTSSYAVTVDGRLLGIVADQSVVENAIETVEQQGSSLLGYSYQVNGDVDYQFELSLKSDVQDGAAIQTYFYDQLNTVSGQQRKLEVTVDGLAVGIVKDEPALNALLDDLKNQYRTEHTIDAQFEEDVAVNYVFAADNLMTIEEMQQTLQANTNGETTYTVLSGDTFNAIAYANDMSVSDLQALNPDANINRLTIGQVLNVRELIPALSVRTVEQVSYLQPIECPVETRDDPTIYKGSSKIITQGDLGEAQVEALVTYVNGREREREILSSVTLKEPTVTVKAVGTKPKPKTASHGTYVWPLSGRINSYFGGRYIFGSYSYHSGIDIAGRYGATIVAADGGTVTFSGTKGTYGKLIIITHDNGTQTYYGHCSSLLVSSGTKVYQGQAIAKVGSTGRATGNHLHFEIRANRTSVNPLSYLK